MDIKFLKDNNLIVFEVISGSVAFGTNTPKSDLDIRGVFVSPQNKIYGMDYVDQVSDSTNDTVYYEIKKFMELLEKNNPNILEILFSPDDCIRIVNPVFYQILNNKTMFLTKLCKNTFGGYAKTQIEKARGLNKKIVKPMDKERKTVMDFCSIIDGYDNFSLKDWLMLRGYDQTKCGLSKIPNARDLYALFYDNYNAIPYRGIINEDNTSNEVRLSSIPKGETPMGTVIYNKDAYSIYCKEYKEYFDWVEVRNPERYQTNLSHGKNFDAKNIAHCIRLLRVANEIPVHKTLIVRRPDFAELLNIKNGNVEYEDVISEANNLIENMNDLYGKSDLPESLNHDMVNKILVDIRTEFYKSKKKKLTYKKVTTVTEFAKLLNIPEISDILRFGFKITLLIYNNGNLYGYATHGREKQLIINSVSDGFEITKSFSKPELNEIDIYLKQIELF